MNNFKEINIKNRSCDCFDDIIKIEYFDLDSILREEKLYQNILVYNILYKSLIAAKPVLIRLDKTDGFVRVYDGTRYLVLFGSEKYDIIYDGIRYLME